MSSKAAGNSYRPRWAGPRSPAPTAPASQKSPVPGQAHTLPCTDRVEGPPRAVVVGVPGRTIWEAAARDGERNVRDGTGAVVIPPHIPHEFAWNRRSPRLPAPPTRLDPEDSRTGGVQAQRSRRGLRPGLKGWRPTSRPPVIPPSARGAAFARAPSRLAHVAVEPPGIQTKPKPQSSTD